MSRSGPIENAPESLRDCPPSAKLVATVLAYEGPLTQRGVAEASLLPIRTVRGALRRLENRGLVSSRRAVTDARKRVYRLTDAR
jgi:DNA-binding MarR family transcriptional regulator